MTIDRDAAAPSPPDASRLGAGIGCGLAILFGGWIALGMLMSSIMLTHMSADNRMFYRLLGIVLPTPPVVALIVAAAAYRGGRRHFGRGVLWSGALVPVVLVAIVGFFALLHL